jgi:hypothetical protein
MKSLSKLMVISFITLNIAGVAAFAGENKSPSSCVEGSDAKVKNIASEQSSGDKEEQASKADSAKK